MTGVDLVVSDHHGGLVTAVRIHFQGRPWQRCQTQLSANVADVTPKALQEEVHGLGCGRSSTRPTSRPPAPCWRSFIADFEAPRPRSPSPSSSAASTTPPPSSPLPLHYRTPPAHHQRRRAAQRGDSSPRACHPHLPQPRLGHSSYWARSSSSTMRPGPPATATST